MDLTTTLTATVAGAALVLFCGWRGARPPDLRRGPRMVPWRFLMLLAGAILVLMLVHLAGLAGLAPGR